ncbi:MAG: hypothetical protein OXC19_15600 [Bryobacterales bacterium]|nr:hypothetical protein [Bryobacterales bacterium]
MLSENILRRYGGVLALLLAGPVVAAAGSGALRGRLAEVVDGEPLRLLTLDGETFELIADSGLDRTLRDPQLSDRMWELRGALLDDGRFELEKIFTVKQGQLHRVTYYCVICHITTHEPGLCMCCQDDTDLRELPGE